MLPAFLVSALTGRFDSQLEATYQVELAADKERMCAQTYFLAALLYLSFIPLDMWAMPSNYAKSWAIRLTVIVLSLLAAQVPRLRPALFLRHYTLFTCATYLLWGFAIELMILLAQPTDAAWGAYYAGLILVSMALYTWTYLQPLHASLIGLALIVSYITLALVGQHMAGRGGWLVLVANCFFLVSANIVGLFALYTREKFSRQSFLLQRRLAHELELEERAKLQSEFRSQHDVLTGLPNRGFFLLRLDELLSQARTSGSVALLFLDLDGFKPVNDRYGHAAGDHVLCYVADRIRGAIRSTDLAGRLGGDEFVIALSLPDGCGAAIERVIRQVADVIAQPIQYEGNTLRVTASIGWACNGTDSTVDSLLAEADASMYQRKERKSRPVVALVS